MFRRRRAADLSDQPDELSDDEYSDEAEYSDDGYTEPDRGLPGEPAAATGPSTTSGPWDLHDVPEDDEVPRVDLGGIMVPIPDGVELRVEVQDDVPVAAVLVDRDSQLQLHAFAARKSGGLWAEVREEIAASLRGNGGAAEDSEGPFGAELRARLPQEDGARMPARFLGVDGPRWFLRGLLSGPAASDPTRARRLEEAFRDVVVVRGSDAMAPRDLLPMHLPREAVEMPAPGPEADRRIQLPERGPEITEIQ